MEGRNLVSWPAILGTLGLVVLGLLGGGSPARTFAGFDWGGGTV